jgi:hypothetical protein
VELGKPGVLRAVNGLQSAAGELPLQGAAHGAHSVRGATEGTEGAGALAADDGFRHRVLLLVSAWFYCCLAWPVEAVETPKHGDQGLGQHLAKDAQRKETALHMAPS